MPRVVLGTGSTFSRVESTALQRSDAWKMSGATFGKHADGKKVLGWRDARKASKSGWLAGGQQGGQATRGGGKVRFRARALSIPIPKVRTLLRATL